MIEVGKKCKVVRVSDAGGIFGELLGATVTAAAAEGARGTGAQQFKLDSGGVIYGNADSGFEIEVKN